MAESKMGEEEACLNNKQKKKIQVKECDRLVILDCSILDGSLLNGSLLNRSL